MNSWSRYLAAAFLFLAMALTPLRAQLPIATLTCSGNGQPTLSVPAYAFEFNVTLDTYGPTSEEKTGYVLVGPASMPAVIAAVAAGVTYDSCAVGEGTDSLPLTQVAIAGGYYSEYSAGVVTPQVADFGFVYIVYPTGLLVDNQRASTHLRHRPATSLNHLLDALIARSLVAHDKAPTAVH